MKDFLLSNLAIFLTAIGAVFALITAVFLNGKFSPNIALQVIPTWSKDEGVVKFSILVENQGIIRVGLNRVLFHTDAFKLEDEFKAGGEWIAFEDGDAIISSSTYINPKEVIAVERLYRFDSDEYLHVGVQVGLKYPWFIAILGVLARSTRQTRTYYFARQFVSNNPSSK